MKLKVPTIDRLPQRDCKEGRESPAKMMGIGLAAEALPKMAYY